MRATLADGGAGPSSTGRTSLLKYMLPNYEEHWKNWVIFAIGLIAAVAGGITVWAMYRTPADAKRPEWAKSALIWWTILPPLWFWAEYWLLCRSDPCASKVGELDRFKHAQELGRNVWLAFVALLAAFFFK